MTLSLIVRLLLGVKPALGYQSLLMHISGVNLNYC